MDKLSLVHRIMLGRAFTLMMVLVNIGVIVPITVQEFFDWLARWSEVRGLASGEDLTHVFPGQGPIGVILVALGVVLEGRHTFLRKMLKHYQLDELPGQEAFCDICELYGFYLLVAGLVIECCSELVKFVGVHNHAVLLTFGGVSLVLNSIAIVLLLQLSFGVARLQLWEGTNGTHGSKHS
jgi:hypothetical protein